MLYCVFYHCGKKYVPEKPHWEQPFFIAHTDFLSNLFNSGCIVFSGFFEVRLGGLTLVEADDLNEVENLFRNDPFIQNQVAEIEIFPYDMRFCRGIPAFRKNLDEN